MKYTLCITYSYSERSYLHCSVATAILHSSEFLFCEIIGLVLYRSEKLSRCKETLPVLHLCHEQIQSLVYSLLSNELTTQKSFLKIVHFIKSNRNNIRGKLNFRLTKKGFAHDICHGFLLDSLICPISFSNRRKRSVNL